MSKEMVGVGKLMSCDKVVEFDSSDPQYPRQLLALDGPWQGWVGHANADGKWVGYYKPTDMEREVIYARAKPHTPSPAASDEAPGAAPPTAAPGYHREASLAKTETEGVIPSGYYGPSPHIKLPKAPKELGCPACGQQMNYNAETPNINASFTCGCPAATKVVLNSAHEILRVEFKNPPSLWGGKGATPYEDFKRIAAMAKDHETPAARMRASLARIKKEAAEHGLATILLYASSCEIELDAMEQRIPVINTPTGCYGSPTFTERAAATLPEGQTVECVAICEEDLIPGTWLAARTATNGVRDMVQVLGRAVDSPDCIIVMTRNPNGGKGGPRQRWNIVATVRAGWMVPRAASMARQRETIPLVKQPPADTLRPIRPDDFCRPDVSGMVLYSPPDVNPPYAITVRELVGPTRGVVVYGLNYASNISVSSDVFDMLQWGWRIAKDAPA